MTPKKLEIENYKFYTFLQSSFLKASQKSQTLKTTYINN